MIYLWRKWPKGLVVARLTVAPHCTCSKANVVTLHFQDVYSFVDQQLSIEETYTERSADRSFASKLD